MNLPAAPTSPPEPAPPTVAIEAAPLARGSFLLTCLCVLLFLPFFFHTFRRFPPPPPQSWEVFLAYLLFVPLPVLLVWAVRLYRLGQETPRGLALLAGIGFLISGAVVDLAATMIHSPRLELEANPIVRALLDSGHPLPLVYLYGLIGQAVGVAILCFWWAGFLAHQRTVLDWAWATGPRSYLEFARMTTGGLTWQQIICPLHLADLVAVYRTCYFWFFQTFALIAAALTLPRYYVALVWFGLAPHVNVLVLYLLALAIVLPVYMLWLHGEYTIRLEKAVEASPGPNSPTG
jgi:hypothetical protein